MSTMNDNQDARATLQRFFAAEAAYLTAGGPGRASFDELAACLTPDVVLYQAESLPYGGVYKGPAGVEHFMTEMSRYWSGLEFMEQRFVIDGDSAVVFNHGVLTVSRTGCRIETSVMQLITVRAGQISEFRAFYWDTHAIVQALGAPSTLE